MNTERRPHIRFLSCLLALCLLLTILPATAEDPATPTDLGPVEGVSEITEEPEEEPEEPGQAGDPEEEPEEPGQPADPEEAEALTDSAEDEQEDPFLAYLKAGARLYADKDCYRKQQILAEEAVVLVVKAEENGREILYACEDTQGQVVPGRAFARAADLQAFTEDETAAWKAAEHPAAVERLGFRLEPVTFGTENVTEPEETGDKPEETGTEPEKISDKPEETGTVPGKTSDEPEETGTEPGKISDEPEESGTEPEKAGAEPEVPAQRIFVEATPTDLAEQAGSSEIVDATGNIASASPATEDPGNVRNEPAQRIAAKVNPADPAEQAGSGENVYATGYIEIEPSKTVTEDPGYIRKELAQRIIVEANPADPAGTDKSEELAYATGYIEIDPPEIITEDKENTGPADEAEERPQITYAVEQGVLTARYVSYYNGKEQGKLPATRNQNPLGACWSFATIGAMEIDLIKDGNANKDTIDLSELFLNYYVSHNYPYIGGGDKDNISYNSTDAYENNGGSTVVAYRILANLIGTVNEGDARYVNTSEGAGDLTVNGYGKIAAQLSGAYVFNPNDRDAIKQAILDHGSVSAGIRTPKGDDERWTEGGREYASIYKRDTNTLFCNYPGTNHIVLLVGWDDNFDGSKFGFSNVGNGAWLVRNSWAVNAGYSKVGYFWLSYYDVSLLSSGPIAYDAVNNASGHEIADYSYGYARSAYNISYYTKGTQTATVYTGFTVNGNEMLQAVGVETGSNNQKVSVAVKVNGKTVASGQTTARYMGFYRIKLNNAYAASAGTRVDLEVTFATTDGSNVTVPYETARTGSLGGISYTSAKDAGFRLDDREMDGDPLIQLYTQKNGSSSKDPTSITLNKKTMSLKSGESGKLVATILPSAAASAHVTWSSSDKNVAIVEPDGTVYGAPGASGTKTAIITAVTDNGVSATCKVTVTLSRVSVTGVRIVGFPASKKYTIDESNAPAGFRIGSVMTLKAELAPKYPNNKGLTWSSSNTSVMTVKDNGDGTCAVTMNKLGTARITVTANDTANGKKTDYVDLTMAVPVHVDSVYLDCSKVRLYEGNGYQLNATVYPSDATNKDLTWSSSNPAVATVTQTGYVIGTGEGTAVITAKAKDNGKSASCEFTILVRHVESVWVNYSKYSIYEEEGFQLSSAVYPTDAKNKKLIWSSSNPSVATVTQNGYVKGIRGGTAVITAKAEDNGKSASCEFTILSRHVTSVWVSHSWVKMYEGDGFQLTGIAYPDYAANRKIIWSSSNTAVATVTQNGYVKGVRDGTAVITATAADNGMSASCDFTILTADPVEAFVYRMYRVCLQREPDPDGLAYWVKKLKSGGKSGAELVQGFYCSIEMVNRRLSNESYVDRAYEGIMDRQPDSAGKAYWISYLDKGVSYGYIVSALPIRSSLRTCAGATGSIAGITSPGSRGTRTRALPATSAGCIRKCLAAAMTRRA